MYSRNLSWAVYHCQSTVFSKVVVTCPDECAVESSRTWSIRTFTKDSKARFVVITNFLGRPCSVQSFSLERESVRPCLKCCNNWRNKIYVFYDNRKRSSPSQISLTILHTSSAQLPTSGTYVNKFEKYHWGPYRPGPGLHLQAQHLK